MFLFPPFPSNQIFYYGFKFGACPRISHFAVPIFHSKSHIYRYEVISGKEYRSFFLSFPLFVCLLGFLNQSKSRKIEKGSTNSGQALYREQYDGPVSISIFNGFFFHPSLCLFRHVFSFYLFCTVCQAGLERERLLRNRMIVILDPGIPYAYGFTRPAQKWKER